VWRLVGAEAFVADTPLWTYSDNALNSRIARVEGLIERFDTTNVDQQINALFYNLLGRSASASEIATYRDQIALLDQDVTDIELEEDIEQQIGTMETSGLSGSLQTQIGARIQQQFGEEAQLQRGFASAQAFGRFGRGSDVDEPIDIAPTVQQRAMFGKFGE